MASQLPSPTRSYVSYEHSQRPSGHFHPAPFVSPAAEDDSSIESVHLPLRIGRTDRGGSQHSNGGPRASHGTQPPTSCIKEGSRYTERSRHLRVSTSPGLIQEFAIQMPNPDEDIAFWIVSKLSPLMPRLTYTFMKQWLLSLFSGVNAAGVYLPPPHHLLQRLGVKTLELHKKDLIDFLLIIYFVRLYSKYGMAPSNVEAFLEHKMNQYSIIKDLVEDDPLSCI